MKKKKRRKIRVLKIILYIILIAAVLTAAVVFLFRTRSFDVEGNFYYSENTITSWIQNEKNSGNTLLVLFRYRFMDPELPSGVEEMDVSLKNPWTLHINVTEKELSGYVDYDGAYLYFDTLGTAVLRTTKVIEDVPYIEGLAFDAAKVEIREKLPVEDDGIFERIVEVSGSLKKYGLTPDRITCTDGSIQLYFGVVEVLLGQSGYDEKLEQAGVILPKLAELYPDTAGTLHLENYTSESESIRFVPAG